MNNQKNVQQNPEYLRLLKESANEEAVKLLIETLCHFNQKICNPTPTFAPRSQKLTTAEKKAAFRKDIEKKFRAKYSKFN